MQNIQQQQDRYWSIARAVTLQRAHAKCEKWNDGFPYIKTAIFISLRIFLLFMYNIIQVPTYIVYTCLQEL